MHPNEISIDYEKVVGQKLAMLRQLYYINLEENGSLLDDIKNWIDENPNIKYWLPGYCVFKYLCDVFGTVDFNKWTPK